MSLYQDMTAAEFVDAFKMRTHGQVSLEERLAQGLAKLSVTSVSSSSNDRSRALSNEPSNDVPVSYDEIDFGRTD